MIFLTLFIVAFYTWLLFFNNSPLLLSYGSLFFLLTGTLLSTCILYYSYRKQKDENKKFILLLMLGSSSIFIGHFFWALYEIFFKVTPTYFGMYDIFWTIQYIFFIWALLSYYQIHKVQSSINYFIDILILITVSSTLSWVFLIKPFLLVSEHSLSFFTAIFYLGYPLADGIVLIIALILYFYTPLSKSLLFIVSGSMVIIVANSIYFIQYINDSYYTGSLIDPLWVLAGLLTSFSSLYITENNKGNEKNLAKRHYLKLFIPYLAIIIFLFAASIIFSHTKELLIGVFIAVFLLIIRLFNTILINDTLQKELEKKNSQLETALEQIKFSAYHDALTGLPNRYFLHDRMQMEIDKSKDKRNTSFALLFIDLDGFKLVNDTHGHHIGDELLKKVAVRLKEVISKDEFLCRFAGDEFIIILPNTTKQKVTEIAQAIVQSLSKPYVIEDKTISISSSVGISFYKENDTIQSIISKADQAMYHIKKNGKNNFGFIPSSE